MRYAKNCFCYDKHQWVNQGCVAVDDKNEHMGIPLNQKGGGIFVLEWDPVNRHIRSWAFLQSEAPQNLRDAIRTAKNTSKEQVEPDPRLWPLPYAYFAIGALKRPMTIFFVAIFFAMPVSFLFCF